MDRKMKIIVTGSLGNISKPLTKKLLQNGHDITVISSKPGRREEIEALGATAAIGRLEDVPFLTATFTGADAVYGMVPPKFEEPDQVAYYVQTGENYVQAIRQSGVKRVVGLSSYGAHLEKGTGFIVGSHLIEQMFNELPEVTVTHIRPGYFYYNLLSFIKMIKTAGFIGSNFGGEDQLPMVAPEDIAAAIAEEITAPDAMRPIRYVVSDDRTCNEVAHILGEAIGKPGLEWKTLTNEQVLNGLIAGGMLAPTAAKLVELGAALHNGTLREDYDRQEIALGKVKIEAFAKEFAVIFKQNN